MKRGRGRPQGINRFRIDITLSRPTLDMLEVLKKTERNRSRAIEKAVRRMYRELNP